MPEFPQNLKIKLFQRKSENAYRILGTDPNCIDFASNDYLGFARNAGIFKRASALLSKKGMVQNGSTGSRLLTGNSTMYNVLEHSLAAFHNVDAALVFNSGYDANTGFFGVVPQRGDVVFYDEFVHASIRDGIRLGHAKSFKFKHNSLEDLKTKCRALRNRITEAESSEVRNSSNTEIYIVTESVFSMDGDSPDLKELSQFCSLNKCFLVVDEAHAVGTFGERGSGLVQELQLQDQLFARIVTFGKAIGCHGATILGSTELISYLVNFARSFIYTTALPPHNLATILTAYDYLATKQAKEARSILRQNINFFKLEIERHGLDAYFTASNSPIQCCILPGNNVVRTIAQNLDEQGFQVKPILAPTVPMGQERLRFCLHSYNSKTEIGRVLQLLKEYL